MKKYKKYKAGGKVGFEDVAGLAGAFANPIAAIPSALNLIGKLAYNPASYTPAKMNESPMGYAYGGDMKQQLTMLPDVDKALGEHAVEVQGNPGIDTNYRNIDGQDVALTEGEIVRQDQDGSAYVWSNNPKMKHSSGETFAKAMKPVENKIAKIKRRIEKDPTDYIASTTLGHLEQIIEQNKNEEEMLRQAKGSPTAQAYNKGGYIKAKDGYKFNTNNLDTEIHYALMDKIGLDPMTAAIRSNVYARRSSANSLKSVSDIRNYEPNVIQPDMNIGPAGDPWNEGRGGSHTSSNPSFGYTVKRDADPKSDSYGSIVSTSGYVTDNDVMNVRVVQARNSNKYSYGPFIIGDQLGYRRPKLKGLTDASFGVSPTIQSGSQKISNSPFSGTPQNFLKDNPSPLTSVTGNGLPNVNDSLSTFEDKAFLGAKGLETVGRIANALQRPKQYDTRKYNVDKIKYNPNRVLDRNEVNYQGSQFDINTGNANTDRILRNNLYGQKLQADRDVYREYDQMQRQSDLQVDQYNAQAMMNVDNINEQIQGRQQQARDAALTSIGNMASIFQQAGGAKAHNKITLATLNSLSKRYGIDVPNLMLLMEGQGDTNKGVVNYKGK